jgi:hypothetical protein
MTEDECRAYAKALIEEHAIGVEFLTIHECAEDNVPGGVISDEDARAVDALIRAATVTVTWGDETR